MQEFLKTNKDFKHRTSGENNHWSFNQRQTNQETETIISIYFKMLYDLK